LMGGGTYLDKMLFIYLYQMLIFSLKYILASDFLVYLIQSLGDGEESFMSMKGWELICYKTILVRLRELTRRLSVHI